MVYVFLRADPLGYKPAYVIPIPTSTALSLCTHDQTQTIVGEDSFLGSVQVRSCVPSFVVYTTLVMSNFLLAECNAAMKFSYDCPSLLFPDMAVQARWSRQPQTLNVT